MNDTTRHKFFGRIYRQRLNVIRNLIEEIADEANGVDEEKIVEELLFHIGNLKIAQDAAKNLLEDLEDDLRSKFQFEDMGTQCAVRKETPTCQTTH